MFAKLTTTMEGDGPTGALVIPKYMDLKDHIEDKIEASHPSDSLYPMHCVMLNRVQDYLTEAMQCDTLIIATILHPFFRLTVFEMEFGAESIQMDTCRKLIEATFARFQPSRDASNTQESSTVSMSDTSSNPRQGFLARLAAKASKVPHSSSDELEKYLVADISLKGFRIDDLECPLKWWKVSGVL